MNFWYTPNMSEHPPFSKKLIDTLESEAFETTILFLKTRNIKDINNGFLEKMTYFNANLKNFIFLKCSDKKLSAKVNYSEWQNKILNAFETIDHQDKEPLLIRIKEIFTQIQMLKSSQNPSSFN